MASLDQRDDRRLRVRLDRRNRDLRSSRGLLAVSESSTNVALTGPRPGGLKTWPANIASNSTTTTVATGIRRSALTGHPFSSGPRLRRSCPPEDA